MSFIIQVSVFGGGDTFVIAEEFEKILIVVKARAAGDLFQSINVGEQGGFDIIHSAIVYVFLEPAPVLDEHTVQIILIISEFVCDLGNRELSVTVRATPFADLLIKAGSRVLALFELRFELGEDKARCAICGEAWVIG